MAAGLREHGWVEGDNIQVDYRYFSDRLESIPALAAELAALKPEVIVAVGPLPARAVRSAAPMVPLVFLGIADPIGLGLVESLARPGGNATRIATIVPEGFGGKQSQILKELVPQASRIAVLSNPENPIHRRSKPELPEIDRQLNVSFIVVEATGLDQAEAAFDAASKQGADAIEIWGDPYILVRSAEIVALVARYRLPRFTFFGRTYWTADWCRLVPTWPICGSASVIMSTRSSEEHNPPIYPYGSQPGTIWQ